MLFTVDRFRVPGVIEAERAGVVKRVYVKEGLVVHATSSDRADSLGNYLLRTGRLSAEEFERTMAERAASNRRYGHLLIEHRLLSPGGIYQAVREQVEAIVWSLFYWEDGEVRFRIGSFDETGAVRIQLPMRRVILAGIKRAPNAKALIARLGTRSTLFEPAFRIEDLIEAGLEAEEYELLTLVDGERSLYELCQEGPLSPAENAKLLYAFQVLRLVRRHEAAAGESAPAGEPPFEMEEPAAPSSLPATSDPAPPAAVPGASDGSAAAARDDEAAATGGGRKVIKIKLKTGGDRFTR